MTAAELLHLVGLGVGITALAYIVIGGRRGRHVGTVAPALIGLMWVAGVPAAVEAGDWAVVTLRLFVGGLALAVVVYDAAKRAESIRQHPSGGRR